MNLYYSSVVIVCAYLFLKKQTHKKKNFSIKNNKKNNTQQRVGFCYQSARSIGLMTVKHTYRHSLTTHSFFPTCSPLSLPLSLSIYLGMCSCVHAHSGGRFIHRFYISSTYYLVPLKLFAFYSNWMNFVLYLLLFFLWFHFICSMLCYHRLLVFFFLFLGCAHCFGSLYHTDYVYDVYKVNEIKIHNESKATKQKQKQQREKNECKVRTSRISELCLMFDDDHSKYVQLCTVHVADCKKFIQTIHTGHTKYTNASDQNQPI